MKLIKYLFVPLTFISTLKALNIDYIDSIAAESCRKAIAICPSTKAYYELGGMILEEEAQKDVRGTPINSSIQRYNAVLECCREAVRIGDDRLCVLATYHMLCDLIISGHVTMDLDGNDIPTLQRHRAASVYFLKGIELGVSPEDDFLLCVFHFNIASFLYRDLIYFTDKPDGDKPSEKQKMIQVRNGLIMAKKLAERSYNIQVTTEITDLLKDITNNCVKAIQEAGQKASLAYIELAYLVHSRLFDEWNGRPIDDTNRLEIFDEWDGKPIDDTNRLEIVAELYRKSIAICPSTKAYYELGEVILEEAQKDVRGTPINSSIERYNAVLECCREAVRIGDDRNCVLATYHMLCDLIISGHVTMDLDGNAIPNLHQHKAASVYFLKGIELGVSPEDDFLLSSLYANLVNSFLWDPKMVRENNKGEIEYVSQKERDQIVEAYLQKARELAEASGNEEVLGAIADLHNRQKAAAVSTVATKPAEKVPAKTISSSASAKQPTAKPAGGKVPAKTISSSASAKQPTAKPAGGKVPAKTISSSASAKQPTAKPAGGKVPAKQQTTPAEQPRRPAAVPSFMEANKRP